MIDRSATTVKPVSDKCLAGLPPKLQGLIKDEVSDGEEIVWADAPDMRRFMLRFGACGLFMGLPFAVLGVVVSVGSWGSDLTCTLSSSILFLMGATMLCSPLFAKRQARSTAYVITVHRAIIFEAASLSPRVSSFGPEHVADMKCKVNNDGTGDIIFGKPRYPMNRLGPWDTGFGFVLVPEAQKVAQLLSEMARANKDK